MIDNLVLILTGCLNKVGKYIMIQQIPHSFTKPPTSVVKSWLTMTKQGNNYNRNRALDLIKLVFGSVEFAERYVEIESTKHCLHYNSSKQLNNPPSSKIYYLH